MNFNFKDWKIMDIEERIWTNEKRLVSATGLNKKEAEEIFNDFDERIALNKIGRPKKLSNKSLFIMLMMHLRNYQTLEVLGSIFGLHKSNVKRWIDRLVMVLEDILRKKKFYHLIAA
jgi:Helix-turn-helix of DDE superfamily endonuclease